MTETIESTSRDQVLRRSFLCGPGEPLLTSPHMFEAAIRFELFIEATGLNPDDVAVSTLLAIPVPLYPASWPDGYRRWPGIRPEVMWHPLMWLPERVAHRYQIVTDDGAVRVETEDEWMVRLGLELTMSGLYDEQSGGWVDVLALAGLDIDNDADLARIEEWLAGEPDDILDRIDLTAGLTRESEPEWALHVAQNEIDDLRSIAAYRHAEGLLGTCDSLIRALTTSNTATNPVTVTNQLVLFAASRFATLPGQNSDEWDNLIVRSETIAANQPDTINDVLGVLYVLSEMLANIVEDLEPHIKTLGNEDPFR